MNKILVKLYVPAIEKKYDVFNCNCQKDKKSNKNNNNNIMIMNLDKKKKSNKKNFISLNDKENNNFNKQNILNSDTKINNCNNNVLIIKPHGGIANGWFIGTREQRNGRYYNAQNSDASTNIPIRSDSNHRILYSISIKHDD